MDRARQKKTKRRPERQIGLRANKGDPSSPGRDEKTNPKTAPVLPKREPKKLRSNQLQPFVALVQIFNEFLFELDAEGKFLNIWTSNDALPRERRQEFLGRRALEVLGEDIFRPFKKLFQRVIKQHASEDIEFPIDTPDGRRWFQARVYAVGGGAKKSNSVCLLARDITLRRIAEDKLTQREALLAHAEEVTGIGCWELNVETDQRVWSRQLYRLYGFDPQGNLPTEEAIFAMTHPDDRLRVRLIQESAVRECKPFQSEGRYTLPDGRLRILAIRGIPLPGETGKATRLIGVVQDVTDQREAEGQIRRSESLLSQAERLACLGSWEYGIEQQSFLWSDQMYRMLGIEPEKGLVPLVRACGMFHPEDRARVWDDVAVLRKQNRPIENEVRFVLPDGRVRTFHSRALSVADNSGRIVRVLGTSQDVTERRQAEQQIRRKEELLAQAEEIARLGSWEVDVLNSTVSCSRELFHMLNLHSQSGTVPLADFWPMFKLEDLDSTKHAFRNAIAEHAQFEHISRCITPEGSIRIFHFRTIPFADDEGRVTRMAGFIHDITEQTRVEEDLRRLSHQLLTLRSEEQRRLAHELHETTSQTLTALKMTLKQIAGLLPGQEQKEHELLKSCDALVSDAIREVRTVSAILHPPLMDEAGLIPGLRSYVLLFTERSGMTVELSLPKDLPRLPREVDLTVFCVVQEALANVHRHAKARSAEICIETPPGKLNIKVSDDGIGMAIPAPKNHRDPLLGIGISGMRERVKQLGGEFAIESSPGAGTTVRVALPIERAEAAH
jgi:PAS domain S-box-containing protein